VQSSNQIIATNKPTNIQFFTGLMPFLSPNQQCQSTEGKKSHSMDLLTPSSPGVFQLCLWQLIATGYLGRGLPCLSSAVWCQYPSLELLDINYGVLVLNVTVTLVTVESEVSVVKLCVAMCLLPRWQC